MKEKNEEIILSKKKTFQPFINTKSKLILLLMEI